MHIIFSSILRLIPTFKQWFLGNNLKYLIPLIKLIILKITKKTNFSDALNNISEDPFLMESVLFTIRVLNKEFYSQMSEIRKKDLELKDNIFANIIKIALILTIIILSLTGIYCLFFLQISHQKIQLLITIIIIIFSCLRDIISYEFGTSYYNNALIELMLCSKLEEYQINNYNTKIENL